MRKVHLPSKPLDLPGSASTSLRNKRPSTQTKSVDPRAQPLLPHTRKQDDVSALVTMFLVDDAESHVDIFLSTSQKKRSKNTCRHKKSLHHDMVCLNKLFECLKNVESFQTPTFSPKTCCLRFLNKFCKRIHDVSLRFVGNSSSEFLRTLHSFIIERHIKLVQVQTVFLSYLTNEFFFFLRSHKAEFDELILRTLLPFPSTKLKWRMWKIYRFPISFYGFKASLCSPCSQRRQRRWKTYPCKVSPSLVKAASYGACKNDVNHHGWAHHQGEKQIHFSQCRKDTPRGKFSQPPLSNLDT